MDYKAVKCAWHSILAAHAQWGNTQMNTSRIRIAWGVGMMDRQNCQKYLWLHGYRSRLVKSINQETGLLPVANAHDLWKQLANGYTLLTVSDGAFTEIIRVEQFGTQIKMYRGQENTTPTSFPAGACVMWEVNKSAVQNATVSNTATLSGVGLFQPEINNGILTWSNNVNLPNPEPVILDDPAIDEIVKHIIKFG